MSLVQNQVTTANTGNVENQNHLRIPKRKSPHRVKEGNDPYLDERGGSRIVLTGCCVDVIMAATCHRLTCDYQITLTVT